MRAAFFRLVAAGILAGAVFGAACGWASVPPAPAYPDPTRASNLVRARHAVQLTAYEFELRDFMTWGAILGAGGGAAIALALILLPPTRPALAEARRRTS